MSPLCACLAVYAGTMVYAVYHTYTAHMYGAIHGTSFCKAGSSAHALGWGESFTYVRLVRVHEAADNRRRHHCQR